MTRHVFAAAMALCALLSSPALASDRFDFYVLALSWSPTYCQDVSPGRAPLQCGGQRPFGFIVHGLWPQYHAGYPSFCATRFYRPRKDIVDNMLPLMPSRSLIYHQWKKHGSCSGLPAREYFDLTRRAFQAIEIPARFAKLREFTMTSPQSVEIEFRRANPALTADAIAVTCNRRRLKEVRICISKNLREFVTCPEVDRRACKNPRIVMPPLR